MGHLRLYCADLHRSLAGGACRVDEFAAEVGYDLALHHHAHAAAVGHVGHMGHLEVLLMAVFDEFLHILLLDYYAHALLALADGELRGVEAAVFHRYSVEIYVESVGELADGHADAAGSEVVRLLDEACHFRTVEEAFDLALLGSVALLHLAAALLERAYVVLLA